MNKKIGHLPKKAALKPSLHNTTTQAQCNRLLAALIELGAVNTLYARDALNVLMPASRIKELREQGHDIFTDRISIKDQYERNHNGIARYVLIKLAEVYQ